VGFISTDLISALAPKLLRYRKRVESPILPPTSFIAGRVIFTMMQGAKRHGELITDFQTHSSRLGKSHMMSV
jgi:hypothetical protein